jgi:hypothetical protein
MGKDRFARAFKPISSLPMNFSAPTADSCAASCILMERRERNVTVPKRLKE